ncbi:WD40 repeat domain-containing protein [Aureibaculum sp. 2210JD6-5]|uniref:YncE family protein n=1 Tax=Aureibaculum sp. 2210JD6-5 TaxID=3103957 RepID=UPI002AAD4813|nr:WD40 repeat domain-containing protein [Aureibaculum sp. 2210JD6-5]MDY7395641.1 WD40 repeat domain-containing protein [Aureibaculum sp. 2210JD6-5]
MKKLTLYLLLGTFLLSSCVNYGTLDDILHGGNSNNGKTDYFAVANRGDGTVTIYDADTQEQYTKITLEDENAAPTYVVYSTKQDRLYVADFNNSKINVYNTSDFSKVGEYPAGNGAFHMWLNNFSNQLWVNNIVDKTTSVISLRNGRTLATLSLPDNINFAEDAAQHDVTISPNGAFAYVSVFSQTGTNYVLHYNTHSLKLMNYIEVGGDPHLVSSHRFLYVLSQDDSSIKEYKYANLRSTNRTGSLANVHGVTLGKDNNLFLTNIADKKVASYNLRSQDVTSVADAPVTDGVAHNISYNFDKEILALTRSGGSTVDFFKVVEGNIEYLSSDVSGANPFGIFYVDR